MTLSIIDKIQCFYITISICMNNPNEHEESFMVPKFKSTLLSFYYYVHKEICPSLLLKQLSKS